MFAARGWGEWTLPAGIARARRQVEAQRAAAARADEETAAGEQGGRGGGVRGGGDAGGGAGLGSRASLGSPDLVLLLVLPLVLEIRRRGVRVRASARGVLGVLLGAPRARGRAEVGATLEERGRLLAERVVGHEGEAVRRERLARQGARGVFGEPTLGASRSYVCPSPTRSTGSRNTSPVMGQISSPTASSLDMVRARERE